MIGTLHYLRCDDCAALPGRVIGAKPGAFCRWVFDLLGAAPGDSLDDLYPGSGAVGKAWATYTGPYGRRHS